MRVDDLPVNLVPGVVSGAGIPTAAIASAVNVLVLLLLLALLVGAAVSLRDVRRRLARLEDRLDRAARGGRAGEDSDPVGH